jgi:hypothetical protein
LKLSLKLTCCTTTVFQIGSFYSLGAVVQHYWCNIYTSTDSGKQLSADQTLLVVGFVVFTVGELINFYHHALFASLRPKGAAAGSYVIPSGGLFGFLVCPHYFG